MRAKTLLPLCLALAVPAAAKESTKESIVSQDPLALQVALAREGQTLKVRYTVRNQSAQRVYLLDQMVSSREGVYEPRPQALIVREEAPGAAALVRGFVDPGHPVLFQYAPAVRALDPGQALTGTAEVALPLQAQHPYGRPAPLTQPVRSVALHIGYLRSADPVAWIRYPLLGGGALTSATVPSVVQGQRFARSAAQPLPR